MQVDFGNGSSAFYAAKRFFCHSFWPKSPGSPYVWHLDLILGGVRVFRAPRLSWCLHYEGPSRTLLPRELLQLVSLGCCTGCAVGVTGPLTQYLVLLLVTHSQAPPWFPFWAECPVQMRPCALSTGCFCRLRVFSSSIHNPDISKMFFGPSHLSLLLFQWGTHKTG